ncbi:MAG: MFS transporter, partial [Sulfolobaceae archaeon]
MNGKLFYILTFLVFLTGLYLGIFRVVFPLQGLNSYSYIVISLVIFGFTKAVMNYIAGFISDIIGRRIVLALGWVLALVLPVFGLVSNSVIIISFLTSLVAVHQAFTWTTTITSQVDISGKKKAGFAAGVNETAGYLGVAIGNFIAGFLITYNVSSYYLMLVIPILALLLSIKTSETKPMRTTLVSKTNYKSIALILGVAGLLEKFVDSFYWIIVPYYLSTIKISAISIAIIVSLYAGSWALLQPITGFISDIKGRLNIILVGFLIMSLGVAFFQLNYYVSALISGIGMSLVYPTLIAAVNDYTDDGNRGRALGIYRLLRDLGYGLAGILLLLVFNNIFYSVLI